MNIVEWIPPEQRNGLVHWLVMMTDGGRGRACGGEGGECTTDQAKITCPMCSPWTSEAEA